MDPIGYSDGDPPTLIVIATKVVPFQRGTFEDQSRELKTETAIVQIPVALGRIPNERCSMGLLGSRALTSIRELFGGLARDRAMTPDQIAAWVAAGESEGLEFKKSTAEKDRACRTLCAFANGQSGRLLFGVTPSGKVVGQSVSDHTLEELAREFQNFEPPLFPSLERVRVGGGREVLVLSVARAARVPVAFRGVAYERVLNTTRTMPRQRPTSGCCWRRCTRRSVGRTSLRRDGRPLGSTSASWL